MTTLRTLAEIDAEARTRFKPFDRFCQEFEPLTYIADGVLRAGSIYTLTAKTGHGKTGLLTTTALAVVMGNGALIGRDVERRRVAYIALENPDDIRMRMIVSAFRLDIDLASIGDRIMVLDRRLPPAEVIAELERLSVPEPFGLIIIDTLAAFFDGDDINNSVQGGEFMRRLRPLTRLPGLPAAIVAAHPVKNATAEQLVPYGSGAILNEVDGNLTLWKAGGIASFHWQGKLRGLEIEPLRFKFDSCCSPDVIDAKGRQVSIPVCVPTTEEAVEDRDAAAGERNLAVLRAIAEEPKGTQREWMQSARLSNGTFGRALKDLGTRKFIEQGADGRWRLTAKGEKEIAR